MQVFNCTIGQCVFVPPPVYSSHYNLILQNITQVTYETTHHKGIIFYYNPYYSEYYDVISIKSNTFEINNTIIYISNIEIRMDFNNKASLLLLLLVSSITIMLLTLLYVYDTYKKRQCFLNEIKHIIYPNCKKVDDICSICLESFLTSTEPICVTNCNHYYHYSCFNDLLKFKDTCAMCRAKFK
jgi:hypothetical protein